MDVEARARCPLPGVVPMTQSERDEAAITLINCVAAVYKQLKMWNPEGNPWVGNMLGTEHLRQLGTSVFIQLNRRGTDPPARVIPASAPAAQGTLGPREGDEGASDTPKPVRTRPRASAGPRKSNPEPGVTMFTCPACGLLKTWHMTRERWPNAVCLDCYNAGRTP